MDPMQELFGPLGSPEDFVEFYEEVVLFERPDWDMPPPAEGATPFYNWDHKNLVLEDMELSSYQGPGSTWMHNYCADKREQCAMDCISGGDCGWSEPGPSDPCMEACIPVECDE